MFSSPNDLGGYVIFFKDFYGRLCFLPQMIKEVMRFFCTFTQCCLCSLWSSITLSRDYSRFSRFMPNCLRMIALVFRLHLKQDI